MYTYKFVNVKHSMWTGKPKESIEDIIEYYTHNGWRLKQVLQDAVAMWYYGRVKTKIIFEKEVKEQSYDSSRVRIPVYDDEFVS